MASRPWHLLAAVSRLRRRLASFGNDRQRLLHTESRQDFAVSSVVAASASIALGGVPGK